MARTGGSMLHVVRRQVFMIALAVGLAELVAGLPAEQRIQKLATMRSSLLNNRLQLRSLTFPIRPAYPLLLLAHACARAHRAFPPTLATEFFGLQGEAAGAALHMETNPLYTTLPDGFGEAGAKILRDLGEIVSAGGKG